MNGPQNSGVNGFGFRVGLSIYSTGLIISATKFQNKVVLERSQANLFGTAAGLKESFLTVGNTWPEKLERSLFSGPFKEDVSTISWGRPVWSTYDVPGCCLLRNLN